MEKIIDNKLCGMMSGVILGDVLGSPHEFVYNSLDYTGKIEYEIEHRSRFLGIRNGVLGQFTDDTDMTISMIKAIWKNNGIYDREMVLKEYLNFANGCSFLGRNTRYLFKGIKTIKSYEKRFNDMKEPEKNCGNGCLMRACGLMLCENFEDALEIDYALTNPNEICKDACTIYLKVMKKIIEEDLGSQRDKDKLKEYLKELSEDTCDEVKKYIKWALEGRKIDAKKDKGYVLKGLYFAFASLFHFNNFEDGMKYVIEEGGDTDTNGAIAGGIMGCFYGKKKIMKSQKENWNIIKDCDSSESQMKNCNTISDIFKYFVF